MLDGKPSQLEVPETIHEYGKSFLLHHENNLTYLTQTLHVFSGNVKRAKTFGYVRHANTLEPLMCKFSGYKYTSDPHPQLLDNTL